MRKEINKMAKSTLKFALAILVTLCLVIIPILGIPQMGFSGMLTDNDIDISNELAEGQLVQFTLAVDSKADEATLTKNANETARIIRKRLSILGYSDAQVNVLSDRKVVAVLPFNADVSIAKNDLSITGDFIFKDNSGKTIISSKDIEECSAYYTTNYSSNGEGSLEYYLTFHLSDEAMKVYTEKTTEIAKSSNKFIKLYIDSTQLSQLTINEAVTENDFSFGPFSSDDAIWFANLINEGPLPQTVVSTTYGIEASYGNGAFGGLFIALAIAFIIAAVIFVVLFKLSGLAIAISAIAALGSALAMTTVFNLGISLSGLATIFFTVALSLLLNAVITSGAKLQPSDSIRASYLLSIKKNAWLIVDLLVLPFIVAVAMMINGSVYTMIFAALIFISVISAAISFGINYLFIGAFNDAGKKKPCVYGN